MSQMLPPELAQALQTSGPMGDQGGGGYGPPPTGGPDPLAALQEVIQVLPGLMAALPDPRDTQDVARCLLVLTGIQTRMMGGQGGNGGQPAAA